MKKLLSVLLCAVMLCTGAVFAEQTEDAGFTVVKIPLPEDIVGEQTWYTVARYTDTKEPINLSMYYDGNVFATIPVEYKDREIEAFVPEHTDFTDDTGRDYEFMQMEHFAGKGVIKGNEKGEARPFDSVTRAEAVTMIMRFIGMQNFEGEENAVFDDVSEDDWFFDTVMSAYESGIVKGDGNNIFSPYRNVSREEMTVMTARAMEYAGLRCVGATVTEDMKDADKISDWAKDAYDMLAGFAVAESEYIDPNTQNFYLKPQESATRYNVSFLLSNATDSCQVYPSQKAQELGFDKEMPVIDGSTSTYPFTEEVYRELFSSGVAHQQCPLSHSKSHASYERLINGEVDMLFASVYPASDILKMAEDKGVELELIPIAYDAMIFFTNAKNPIKGLTKEQISDIYVNNAYSNWSELGGSDAKLYPYCRNNDSGSHAQMEKHFLNGNEIHSKIQQETTSVSMANVLTDVMDVENDDPNGFGLGYSIYYYFHNMDPFYDTTTQLKLLEIDGVYPTDETIADGSYPLSNNTYVVLRKDTPKSSPARKMAEFMLSEAGQKCVSMAGYGALKQGQKK